jgi:dienelactone hydrolase
MQRGRRLLIMGLAAALLAPGFAAASIEPGGQAAPTAARQEPPPLSVYGALPSTELVALSPSGERIALVTVAGDRRLMALADWRTAATLGAVDVGLIKVRDLAWIGEARVLVTTSTTDALPRIGLSRNEFFLGQIYDPETGRIVTMLNTPQSMFRALMGSPEILPADPRNVFVRAFSFSAPGRLGLYRVDVQSGRARLAEEMDASVEDYVLDTSGQVLARSDYDERSRVWSLHLRRDNRFEETWRTEAPLDSPRLLGLGTRGDSVIVDADRPDLRREGRPDAALFDVNLATGVWRPIRFEFEPETVWFHPVTRHLIGAEGRSEEGPRYAFIDPAAGALWATVQNTFPQGSPRLVGTSHDFRRAIVFTSGAGDSGSYSLIDMDDASRALVGLAYPAITPDQVAPVSPVTYAAADGLEIHGYLTTPPGREARDLPLVVLPHGGPASHDVLGFDWWAQAIASRGYAVLQPNFRGSTGYGRDFMEAGYGEWGRKMQTDLSDGVRHLAEEGVIDPQRVCIMGASYGGYAALAGPTLDPGVYRCAVSVNGVSDLRRMVNAEAREGVQRDNQTVRYWNRFMGAERLGDRSLDERSPAQLADRADAPILLIHGRDDTVVLVEQSRLMASALRRAGKPVELVELAGEDHWLSRSETRQRMLDEAVRFLMAHNPPD